MRQPDFPLDPDLMAELEAIDATLRGRIVDPEFAELAELTVMVAAERPRLEPDRSRALDERVLGRFGPAGSPAAHRASWRPSRWAAGLSVALAGAAAVLIATGSVSGGPSGSDLALNSVASGTGHGSSGASSSRAGTPLFKAMPHRTAESPFDRAGSAGGSATGAYSGPSRSGASAGSSRASLSSPPASAVPSTPAPTPSARKTIQSAQLQLSASSRWIDVVAQEVFNVVGQEKGIVRSSSVTAATRSGGYAMFNLSIPSANLADTVTRLSVLEHSRVVSRTDGTQDVNGPYLSDQRRLVDAQALRASLLRQLARATTPGQVDSLQARIRTAEAQINSAQATLHRLEYQISFSQLYVAINGGPVPLPLASPSHSGGGFTLGRAAHDAVNVLTVAAGVALIALAALVPLGLLVALVMWVALATRRRRREQALDAA
jgi:hypothetical protein